MTDPAYVQFLEQRVRQLEAAIGADDGITLPPGVVLAPKPLALLSAIVAGRGQYVSTKAIHAALYKSPKKVDMTTIKVMVAALRKKLEGRATIISQRFSGYAVDAESLPKFTGDQPWT